MTPFADKRVVLTGAGSGIGRALALDLTARGALVALSDIDAGGLAETRALIGAADNRCRYDQLDVADRAGVRAYGAELGAQWGAADYVMNVAGLSRIGDFAHTEPAAFDKVMDVNFYGVVEMCRAFLPQLLETRGVIVNISSVFGLIGFPNQSHYCASKFAVRGFSETLAMELAPRGVAVSCVHPGGVATNIARAAELDALPDGAQSRSEFEDRFAKAARTSPKRAARKILDGAARRKRRIIIGADGHVISAVQRLFPRRYASILPRLVEFGPGRDR